MKTNPKKTRPSGFALVVTLSMMILLTVIAVGLLTLSSVSIRTSGHTSAASVAKNNARLGLMLALGELQKNLGQDTAVSAPASAISDNPAQPHLVGAWNQGDPDNYWHWDPVINGSPSYSNKASNFRGWLVSTTNQNDATSASYPNAALPIGDESVVLVGDGKNPLKDSQNLDTTVVVGKVNVKGATRAGTVSKTGGGYGWAVFDESTKASIDIGDAPDAAIDKGLEIADRSIPRRYRADVVASQLPALADPKQLITLNTAAVGQNSGNSEAVNSRFHDFSTSNIGLLTNTATGGLKTDLSALFESVITSPAPAPAPAIVNSNTFIYNQRFSAANGNPRWSYFRDQYRKFLNVTGGSSEPIYAVNSNKVHDLNVNNTTINKGDPIGYSPSPDVERLLPVIAKMQIVFSIVSHRPHIGERITKWDGLLGKNNYAVPHLVYDVVTTLYNPYDVTLNLSKTRIRVWDPPVAFRFTNLGIGPGAYFRDPANNGGFATLGQMQIDNQYNANARRCFTLVLADGDRSGLQGRLQLKPGEVKVFSPRVAPGWTWSAETGTDDSKRTFFDWESGRNFGNFDNRTDNPLGVETVPGWYSMAGLQIDHLATNNRYGPSKYPNNPSDGDGFVTMRLDHELKVEIKPFVTSSTLANQFQVDLLAGLKQGGAMTNGISDVTTDTLRSYVFNFLGRDPTLDISESPTKNNGIITRQYRINDMLQEASDQTQTKKRAFAMLEMSGRTTREKLTDNKPWLYNNMVVEGGVQDSQIIGLSNQPYDLRLKEITSLDSPADGGIAVESKTNRGYFGADNRLSAGSTFVPMYHVPLAPAASLGDFIHSNLASGSKLPRVVHPFGNSRAHPLIPGNRVAVNGGGGTGSQLLDHSYLLNDSLWDGYYFSSITDFSRGGSGVLPAEEARNTEQVLKDLFANSKTPLNRRLIPISNQDPAERAQEIIGLNTTERSQQLGKYLAVEGPFNVNSTSLDAWCAALMAMRDRTTNGARMIGTSTSLAPAPYTNKDETPFSRINRPLTGSKPADGLLWAGYTALTDSQIRTLATHIIQEIKKRGKADGAPPFSVGEFVNRRPGSTIQQNAGLLQTAIDESGINSTVLDRDSIPVVSTSRRMTGVLNSAVMNGLTAEGTPATLTQGDLMTALAPIITVRGDTFKIRSYGEATNAGTVVARAWCEAVVQRVPDFVDPTEVPQTKVADLKSEANIAFGRRFNVVSFRWLSENEL